MNAFKELSEYEYVSFDLFDTLIFRSFSSYDKVFDYVEYRYNLKNDKLITNFKKNRVNAEKKARKKATYKEVNLDEIYDELKFDQIKKTILKSLEAEIEIETSLPNFEIIELLNNLHAEGKKIVITTDMYLHKNTILSILDKHYINYDYVFVSGTEKKTKQEGTLFLHALNSLSIGKEDIIHIGDNPISDYATPTRLGIKAIQYKRKAEYFPYLIKNKKNDVFVDHCNSIIKNGFYNKKEKYIEEYKIGFTVMGPVIFSFCRWIHRIKAEKNLDALWFFAREGYAIQKVYEILYPEESSENRYVRINKHILRIPLMTESNIRLILKSTLKNNKKATWNDILESFGIKDEDKEKIVLPEGQYLNTFINIESIDNLLNFELRKEIVKLLEYEKIEQTKLLIEYLKSNNLKDKIGIVNNSYSGNGQKLLMDFLNENNMETDLIGLQFAANPICEKKINGRFYSWLDGKKNSFVAYLFERGSLIFEHLLFEPVGTAIRLERDSFGNAIVYTEPTRTERFDFDRIAIFQEGMEDFSRIAKTLVDNEMGPVCMQYFVNLIQNPTIEDAWMLGRIYDDDIDGDRFINDYSEIFRLKILYKNDIYNKISWIQGFLAVKEMPNIVKKLFYIRLWLTHQIHKLTKE